jgi:uncharacterized protein with HEPN domain
MSKTDGALIGDMVAYARKVRDRVAGKTRDEFDADETLQFALAYLILVVGEAASKLSPSARTQLPNLPWSDIINMRHRLVHGYGAVNADIVWDVATSDLPVLIAVLEKFTPLEPPSA